ncbi:hypothetical protein VTK26DRAFT_4495 [Humicola hyalothermophila]
MQLGVLACILSLAAFGAAAPKKPTELAARQYCTPGEVWCGKSTVDGKPVIFICKDGIAINQLDRCPNSCREINGIPYCF